MENVEMSGLAMLIHAMRRLKCHLGVSGSTGYDHISTEEKMENLLLYRMESPMQADMPSTAWRQDDVLCFRGGRDVVFCSIGVFKGSV